MEEASNKAVPMPAASLGNYRSAGLRTLELKRIRFGASPSRVFEAQWQLMRLGSITVAGAVLELPSWRLTSFP
jgi:hypothetical protein